MDDAQSPGGAGEVTRLLECVGRGDPHAPGRLVALVYDELRGMAARNLDRESPGHTLGATALVHEMYLRLAGGGDVPRWQNRRHFFAAAAEAMRRILVDNARHRKAEKRGGGRAREPLDPEAIAAPEPDADLLALDEALAKFEARDPAKAALVKLRSFAGMTVPEAAEALGISASTADRHWAYARAWLRVEMGAGKIPEDSAG